MYERFALKVYNNDEWRWYSDYNNNELRDPTLDIMTFNSEEDAVSFKEKIKYKYTKVEIGIVRASWVEDKINITVEESKTEDISLYIPDSLLEKLEWTPNEKFSWELKDGNLLIKRK